MDSGGNSSVAPKSQAGDGMTDSLVVVWGVNEGTYPLHDWGTACCGGITT
jgi:hypothetical protein